MKNQTKAIADFLIKNQGVDISKYDIHFLRRTIQKRLEATNCDSIEMYFSLLTKSKTEVKQLIQNMAVSYSEFFRDSLTFSVLERIILPHLLSYKRGDKNNEIRMWSAACAAGQEVYSVAMLLAENGSLSKNNKTSFRLFATDYSTDQIELAKTGLYTKSEVANVTLKRLSLWFNRQGNHFEIKPELKAYVNFSFFDLLNPDYSSPPESIFGDFDIVFCANILFYYSPDVREYIIEKVNNSLNEQGFLITSDTEREVFIQLGYHEVFQQSGIFHKMK
jgi:Methylase of chemotaxis methyl-accepting proteins